MDVQEPEIRDPLLTGPADDDRLNVPFIPPVVDDQLLGLGGAKDHPVSCSTLTLYADSSPPEMSPISVVLSANFMMVLLQWAQVQSWV